MELRKPRPISMPKKKAVKMMLIHKTIPLVRNMDLLKVVMITVMYQ